MLKIQISFRWELQGILGNNWPMQHTFLIVQELNGGYIWLEVAYEYWSKVLCAECFEAWVVSIWIFWFC